MNDHRHTRDYVQVVAFGLAGETYGIEITKVKEIILVAGITRMPQMPAFIQGIINLRGTVIPVLDLRRRFEVEVAAYGEETRIVVTRLSGRIVGLIVDSVSQVLKIKRSEIQPAPETIAGLVGDYLVGIAKTSTGMLILLDIDRIVSADQRSSLNAIAPDAAPSAVPAG